MGKLWIEQSGEYEVASSVTAHKCNLKYHAYSYFSRDPARRVTGTIQDGNGKPKLHIAGTWDDQLEVSDIANAAKVDVATDPAKFELAKTRLLWKKNPLPKGAEKRYHFSDFTITLNEMEKRIAPTDSRLRKDQRLMEAGSWPEANTEKQRLELCQRERRKIRTSSGDPWTPRWFKSHQDNTTDEQIWTYCGKYWEAKEKQDWSNCLTTIFD